MIAKAEIRDRLRATLKAISPEARNAASQGARTRLEQQPEWRNVESIFFYAPLPEELDIWPLLRDSLAAGKLICLPRFDAANQTYFACQLRDLGRDVATGCFGVREPAAHCPVVPMNRLDLILVPGVAFDMRGNRLGRGKGFYDRLLAEVRGIKCGVAFDEQIVPEVPVETHDATMDCIVTPTRWVRCR